MVSMGIEFVRSNRGSDPDKRYAIQLTTKARSLYKLIRFTYTLNNKGCAIIDILHRTLCLLFWYVAAEGTNNRYFYLQPYAKKSH